MTQPRGDSGDETCPLSSGHLPVWRLLCHMGGCGTGWWQEVAGPAGTGASLSRGGHCAAPLPRRSRCHKINAGYWVGSFIT